MSDAAVDNTSTIDPGHDSPTSLGAFLLRQVRRLPVRIALNFLLGMIIVLGWPPLKWSQRLFDPDYTGIEDGQLWSELLSYAATFDNASLLVVVTAVFIYALFASTVIFVIKGLLLDWYRDVANLDTVHAGFTSVAKLPLRIIEHFILWVSIALTWLALKVCFEAITPNQVFGFSDLWNYYQNVWALIVSGERVSWQAGLLGILAVPSALSDAYLKRRLIHRLQNLIA